MARKLELYGQQIKPGKSTVINIDIGMLPTHTKLEIPAFVYRGKKEGPFLLITSALHGDEVNGTEMLRRMMMDDMLRPSCGAVIAMPLVNIFGFLHKVRDLPDGKDLNRSFPGSKTGSLARRLANTLMNEVVQHIDCIIDLHTGGAMRTNYPQVRCDFERKDSLRLAEVFAAPFLLDSTEIAGSFRKAASSLGKSIIVYEGGESMRIDELSIREGIAGICRVMNHLGMSEHFITERESKVITHSSWTRAKIAGIFRPFVEYGDKVVEGQMIAHLGDPFGKVVARVHANHEGYIIGLNNEPIVNAGDAIIHIGRD